MGDILASRLADSKVELTLSAAPLSWLPGGPLPAELHTGHKTIDFEHRQLLACMQALRGICLDVRNLNNCSCCLATRQNLCESDLVRLLGDLLAFILDHFKTEENIMRDSLLLMVDRDLCEAHMEDHAAISGKVQEIVAALDPLRTVGLLRQLDDLLGNWMTHHMALHDLLLVRWVERQDSSLGYMLGQSA